jgi:uncharacterized protein
MGSTLQLKGTFEVYRDIVGEFYWRFRASNGDPIATCEGYKSRSDCMRAINSLNGAGLKADIDDQTFISVRVRNRPLQRSDH